jgi:hypothetical protein
VGVSAPYALGLALCENQVTVLACPAGESWQLLLI